MQIEQTIQHNLIQLKDLLQQLSVEEYTQSLTILNGQTIGKHVRHIIEYYICLTQNQSTMCYDDRQRNIIWENELPTTLAQISSIMEVLPGIDIHQKIRLKQLIGKENITVESTIGREMLYCIDHCIHHLAIIKIAVSSAFPTVHVPVEFGIAYSTLNYQKS